MIIRIRKATRQDAEIIVKFNKAMALETENKTLDDDTLSKGVNHLFYEPNKGFYLLAEVNDEIAGQLMITTEWSDWRNSDFWWIQSVYVKSEFRRKGIYRQLHETVLKMVRENRELCGIRLYVDKSNVVAQETYRKLGMDESNYIIMKK